MNKNQTYHGVPALISLFLPGIGQIVKGELKEGIMILLWIIIGGMLARIVFTLIFGQTLGKVFTFFAVSAFWIYQVYDAYNP